MSVVSYHIVYLVSFFRIPSVVAHQKLEIGIRDRRAVSQIEKIEMRNQRDSIQWSRNNLKRHPFTKDEVESRKFDENICI